MGNDILQKIRQRATKGANLVKACNSMSKERALAALKDDADREHADSPHYKGHFDGYRLGRVTRTTRGKSGTSFEKGDLCIFKDFVPFDEHDRREFPNHVVAYSPRTGNDTILSKSDVKEEP